MNFLNRALVVRCGAGAGTRRLMKLVIVSGLVMGGLATSAQAAGSAYSVAINQRTLTITGNAASSRLALRLRAHPSDTLQIDVGDNGSADFQVQRRRFDRIRVSGGAGNDLIRIDESHGVFTATTPTQIDGGAGDDTILGGSGAETLIGGTGNDTIDGGPGADHTQLGAGDDRVVWNPGDGSDVVDGGVGQDALAFNGSAAAEQFRLSPSGTHARLTRDVGAVTMDLAGIERVGIASVGGNDTLTVDDLSGTDVRTVKNDLAATLGGTTAGAGAARTIVNATDGADNIVASGSGGAASVSGLAAQVTIVHGDATRDGLTIAALGGNDRVDATGFSANALRLSVDGGAGDDTILGGAGDDSLVGGDGNDTVVAGSGAETVVLGSGDDQFVWNPGDGSDAVDGGDGHDSMAFNGSVDAEQFHLSANGTHARLTRDVGAITIDLAAIEQLDVASVGGNDTLTVDDLTGTGVTTVTNDLAATLGGTTPGAGTAQTIVNGTDGPDQIVAAGTAGSASITGLAATVNVVHADATRDELGINALGGDDRVDGTALKPDALKFTVDGGTGDDTLLGSPGADVLRGGDGSDFVVGNQGADVVLLGAGDDRFAWNPGDGSDVVEGQDGHDGMTFDGANVSEHFDISANGRRIRFTRDIGNVVMDVDGLEEIDLNALGGSDLLNVNDVSGTDLTEIQTNLAGSQGGDDGSPDEVIVNGTNSADTITASGSAGTVSVTGLAATVDIANANAAQDELAINGLAGDDAIEGSGLTADAIRFHADGGDGADVLVGGAGNDTLLGGNGDDVLIGGPGQDVLDGGPGSNELIQ